MRCLKCGERKRTPEHYLCPRCWFGLPAATRRLLSLTDELARQRYALLLRALKTRPVFAITPQLVTPKRRDPHGNAHQGRQRTTRLPAVR